MAAQRFRYLKRTGKIFLGKKEMLVDDDRDNWRMPLETVGTGSLASLTTALRSSAEGDHYWTNPELHLSTDPEDGFDPRYGSIGLDTNGLYIEINIGDIDLNEVDEHIIGEHLRPMLDRVGAQFIQAIFDESNGYAYMEVQVRPLVRGKTVRDAWQIGEDVVELLTRINNGHLTAETAFDLTLAGKVELLVGHRESDWLEAKSLGYDLDGDAGQIELAQDIARFANGSTSGLLVIGLVTKKSKGIETITSVLPSGTAFPESRYLGAIDRKLFPPIAGIKVQNVQIITKDGRAGHILAILIPAQPEEYKPLLVHGAIVGAKVEGAFISIIQRRGEESIPTRPEAIHATIAAGRALLRHGKIPREEEPTPVALPPS